MRKVTLINLIFSGAFLFLATLTFFFMAFGWFGFGEGEFGISFFLICLGADSVGRSAVYGNYVLQIKY